MAEVKTITKSTEEKASKAKKEKKNELVVRARFLKHAPDKLRLTSNLVKSKQIEVAIEILKFTPKAPAKTLILVLKNALDQAKDKDLDIKELFIKSVAVNEGPKLKRRRIVHRGRATTILKRMSHITISLGKIVKGVPNGTQS